MVVVVLVLWRVLESPLLLWFVVDGKLVEEPVVFSGTLLGLMVQEQLVEIGMVHSMGGFHLQRFFLG